MSARAAAAGAALAAFVALSACTSFAGGGGGGYPYYPAATDISAQFGSDDAEAGGDGGVDAGGTDVDTGDSGSTDVGTTDVGTTDVGNVDAGSADADSSGDAGVDGDAVDPGDTGVGDSTPASDALAPDTLDGASDASPDTSDAAPDSAADISSDTGSDTNPSVPAPAVGDLVLSEFMANPAAVSDSDGEWIELCNVATGARSLAGVSVGDAKDSHVLAADPPLIVAAGACVVLGRNKDVAANGGVPVAYAYGSAFLLNNTGAESITLRLGTVVLDSIAWGTSGDGWPAVSSGRSTQVDPAQLHHIGNDAGSAWCSLLQPTFGAGEIGTPGKANLPCK